MYITYVYVYWHVIIKFIAKLICHALIINYFWVLNIKILHPLFTTDFEFISRRYRFANTYAMVVRAYGRKKFPDAARKTATARYSSQLSVVFRDLPANLLVSVWHVPAVCKYRKHIFRQSIASSLQPVSVDSANEMAMSRALQKWRLLWLLRARKFEGTFVGSEENMIARKLWSTTVLLSWNEVYIQFHFIFLFYILFCFVFFFALLFQSRF